MSTKKGKKVEPKAPETTPKGVLAGSRWRKVKKLDPKLEGAVRKLIDDRKATNAPAENSEVLFPAKSVYWKDSITQLAQGIMEWAFRNHVNVAEAFRWAMALRTEEYMMERLRYLHALMAETPNVRKLVTNLDKLSVENAIAAIGVIVSTDLQEVTDTLLRVSGIREHFHKMHPAAVEGQLRFRVCLRG